MRKTRNRNQRKNGFRMGGSTREKRNTAIALEFLIPRIGTHQVEVAQSEYPDPEEGKEGCSMLIDSKRLWCNGRIDEVEQGSEASEVCFGLEYETVA